MQPQPSQPELIDRPRLPLGEWMPSNWRRAAAGQVIELRIPKAVRRRLHKPKLIPPSEWSVKNRRMPDAEAHPGAYRVEFARHASFVMDTWAQPWVREIWYCGVDQASKTNTMLSCLGWSIEHAPGNVFYQMPDQKSSDKIMSKKLIPMLRGSPRLARHLSPRADDTALNGVALTNGVSIIPSWSGSTASTATFSARDTFNDEVDKMNMVGKEASPMDRIKKRTRTNPFGKHFFSSTPACKWIYKGMQSCPQVWEAAVRCPGCGELIVMDEEHVIFPEDATVESVEADPSCVEYACNACGLLWDEAARRQAYVGADWVCVKGKDVKRPSKVGFHLPAFPIPDVSLAHIATVMLKAEAGDISAKIDLDHGIKAIDHKPVMAERKEDAILALREERPPLLVPSDALLLTIGIDTQDYGLWYEIRAWLDVETSTLIRCGFLAKSIELDGEKTQTDFNALKAIIQEPYFTAEGVPYNVRFGLQDLQGHRTDAVYKFCKNIRMIKPSRGQQRKLTPITYGKVDVFPGSGKLIPGGLQIVNFDTNLFKDSLALKLAVNITDPGSWRLHNAPLEDYAKHYVAEYVDEKTNLWTLPDNKPPNHLWDCGVLNLVAAKILENQGIFAQLQAQARPAPAPVKPRPADKPNALAGRILNPHARR